MHTPDISLTRKDNNNLTKLRRPSEKERECKNKKKKKKKKKERYTCTRIHIKENEATKFHSFPLLLPFP